MKNAEYKYNKYVTKIANLLNPQGQLNGGARRKRARKIDMIAPVSNSKVIDFEEQNKDIFLDNTTYMKVLKQPTREIGDNDSVKVILSDDTYDFDNTFVTEMDVYDNRGQWKNEVLDGGRMNC